MKREKLQNKNVIRQEVTIRSSAAEYLTFIAATGDNPDSIEMRYEGENVWLTQKMMAELYGVDIGTINEHLLNIYADNELIETSTIRKFRIVQIEGARKVEREINHYNLHAIIAVGFKINNQRAVQFRKWANTIVKEYTIQGWSMDVERLKNFGTVLTKDYFEKQLEVIREIRLSERRFHQKITDIYSTALDYDSSAKTTIDFFKKVQNKLYLFIPNVVFIKAFFSAMLQTVNALLTFDTQTYQWSILSIPIPQIRLHHIQKGLNFKRFR